MRKDRSPRSRSESPGDRLLCGKRKWLRQQSNVDVRCTGDRAEMQARIIDVSRGGVLLEVDDDRAWPVPEGEFVSLAALVCAAFQKGLGVHFARGGLVRQAQIVRVTTNPMDPTFLRLGCRFLTTLTSDDCEVLGIDPTDAPDPVLDFTLPDEERAQAARAEPATRRRG